MTTMPDLWKPYSSEAERGSDAEVLILCQYGIDGLITLAGRPIPQWSREQESLFPRSVPDGRPEHPQHRLRRWMTVYEREIEIVHDVRSRLVRGRLVADAELRGAAYLAQQILSVALGVPPDQVDAAQVHALSACAANYRWPEAGRRRAESKGEQ
jgi:hypothetical protein